MTAALLDTSACIAFLTGHPGITEAIQREETLFVNPVILGEMLVGVRHGGDPGWRERKLMEFLAAPRVSLLPIDEGTSERYAEIHNHLRTKGTPVPANDLWIAATAMQHGLPLLTLDAHFKSMPQILVRLFEARLN